MRSWETLAKRFMHLLQIFLPVFDNAGQRFEQALFEDVRSQLFTRFGGLTAFVQSPALGLWKDTESGEATQDAMILIEVMSETLDADWWAAYRRTLEAMFRQDEIVIRALDFQRI